MTRLFTLGCCLQSCVPFVTGVSVLCLCPRCLTLSAPHLSADSVDFDYHSSKSQGSLHHSQVCSEINPLAVSAPRAVFCRAVRAVGRRGRRPTCPPVTLCPSSASTALGAPSVRAGARLFSGFILPLTSSRHRAASATPDHTSRRPTAAAERRRPAGPAPSLETAHD